MLPRRRPHSRIGDALRTLTRALRRSAAPSNERTADAAAGGQGVRGRSDAGTVDGSDPTLSWIQDPHGAPEHWLRRIREASLPPVRRPGRHQADPADPVRHDPALPGPVLPGPVRGSRPEPIGSADYSGDGGSERGVADRPAATRSSDRPALRLRLRSSDHPVSTPPSAPGQGNAAGTADRQAGSVAPHRIVLRTSGMPSSATGVPAAPVSAASPTSAPVTAVDGDRVAASAAPAPTFRTPTFRTPTFRTPTVPVGAPGGIRTNNAGTDDISVRSDRGARGEPARMIHVAPTAPARGSVYEGSPPDRPHPAPAHVTARALAAVAPAAAHPWPELSAPRPLPVSGASTESVIRQMTRARRLAAEQASV
ncbi:hypothetical protein [Cryobacterium psychrophilum]|uniref:Uncharacterized protein n=1 Tax=Cryobacterium psychrophilum TaxID=41988 RepID=A0A4Y8KK49_9MICO|nr:hypothetical protein [Cryobacterium psychrophilum]TDW30877.1 hypothetical protein EDD25_2656 [Cryobacterium psychrophilum]TFD75735.1 hypothetical protein E3T53_14730 [Cryobacterium psychrophilum]